MAAIVTPAAQAELAFGLGRHGFALAITDLSELSKPPILAGLRIVELSAFVAAPLGGATLAALGPTSSGSAFRPTPYPNFSPIYFRIALTGGTSTARPEGRDFFHMPLAEFKA